MSSLERFSAPALRAMQTAEAEARALGHEYVGTEHVLLALASGEAAAAQVLAELGASRDGIKKQIKMLLGAADSPARHQKAALPLTPKTRLLVAHAVGQADLSTDDQVSPLHLLLALSGDEESVSAQVLLNLDVTPSRLRCHTQERLGQN